MKKIGFSIVHCWVLIRRNRKVIIDVSSWGRKRRRKSNLAKPYRGLWRTHYIPDLLSIEKSYKARIIKTLKQFLQSWTWLDKKQPYLKQNTLIPSSDNLFKKWWVFFRRKRSRRIIQKPYEKSLKFLEKTRERSALYAVILI